MNPVKLAKSTAPPIPPVDPILSFLEKYIGKNKMVQHICEFYTTANMSMLIASAIVSVSILMTLALLSQGQKHSIFAEGISWGKTNEKEIRELEKLTDEAEEEVFGEAQEDNHGITQAEIGTQVFMQSSLPALTIFMALIALGGSYHFANQVNIK